MSYSANHIFVSQLKQTLKDQGVTGDLALSWRKQPEREVFHKDEEGNKETKPSV